MSKLILIIEDDPAISDLYKDILSDAGYQVRLMTSKPEDVSSIEQIMPNLIISDWGLNQEDHNWNFINSLRDTPSTAAIPIVVCTALLMSGSGTGNRLNELKIEVVQKPFDIVKLLQLVDQTIGN